ncbi:MAG: TrkH family potassium uptake protein [Eggerthellaceae bacterium]|jgi:trk system potassium uptake protein TrkH
MWQRYTFSDFRTIGHYLGDLVLLVAVAQTIPLIIAIIFQEWDPAVRYLYSIGASLIIGSSMCWVCSTPRQLNRQQALAVVGFAWIVLALIGAIPLYGSGHFGSYLDALFDSVSGFTSTGASVISDLDHLSYADNMWRFIMHLMGGMGLVVVMLSLGLFAGSGSSLYSSEGRDEHVLPNVVQTTRLIARISLMMIGFFSLILIALCLLAGMEPARAILHGIWIAISALMTAGFTPMSSNIYYYHSTVMEVILMVMMLLGGVNFGLYAAAWRGKFSEVLRDTELKTMFLWLTLLVVIGVFALSASSVFSSAPALMRRGLFMIIAAASTTGFSTITPDKLALLATTGAFFVLALAMSAGLSAGSTAGGIKLRRLAIIARSVESTIKKTASPESMRSVSSYRHVGRQIIDDSMMKEAMTIFALFVGMYAVGSLVGVAYGYDATTAIFDSVAMASNGGLTAGIVSSDMPVGLELLYIFEMWAGRLEFVTLFALIAKIFASLKPRIRRRSN